MTTARDEFGPARPIAATGCYHPPPCRSSKARGLVKAYRGRGRVVKDVSYHVEPGEIVGLLGPNGAGKTTSFRMTIGMIRADAGEVLFLDHDVTRCRCTGAPRSAWATCRRSRRSSAT